MAEKDEREKSVFGWNPLGTEEQIDAYLRECWASGDETVIREAEYLAGLAKQHLLDRN